MKKRPQLVVNIVDESAITTAVDEYLTTNAPLIRKSVDPTRLDPTRTLTLRKAFTTRVRRQFARLRGEIYMKLVTEDALGLARRHDLAKAVSNSFNPDQLRDEAGRWVASGGSSLSSEAVPTSKLLEKIKVTSPASPDVWKAEVSSTQGHNATARAALARSKKDYDDLYKQHEDAAKWFSEAAGHFESAAGKTDDEEVAGEMVRLAGVNRKAAEVHAEAALRVGPYIGKTAPKADWRPSDFIPEDYLVNEFDPDQPRDTDGKFASAGGPDATSVDSKVNQVLEFAKGLPGKMVGRVKEKISAKYAKLEKRYGKGYARAIIGAALVGLPLPMPGASFVSASVVIGLAELHRMARGMTKNELADMLANAKRIPGLKRVSAGHHVYTHPSGKEFVITRTEEGHWNVAEKTGDTPYHYGPPFDAASTLEEAVSFAKPSGDDQPRDELGRWTSNEEFYEHPAMTEDEAQAAAQELVEELMAEFADEAGSVDGPREMSNEMIVWDGTRNLTAEEVAEAAADANPNPTRAQWESGNYAKGHVTIQGLRITIETAAGNRRQPQYPPLKNHYGYIKRTLAGDGDHVDVFLGPDPESDQVFVVDQYRPVTYEYEEMSDPYEAVISGPFLSDPGPRKNFDEHKVMIGWHDQDEAHQAYLDNYGPGWKGFGGITEVSMSTFKEWLEEGDLSQPIADQELTENYDTTNAGRWAEETDPDKLRAFREWLAKQLDIYLRGTTEQKLWEEFARQGFKKGAGRAFEDVEGKKRTGFGSDDWQRRMDFYAGTKEQFLRSSFGRPETVEKLQILARRSFDDLSNVTDDMATRIQRTLVDGLSRGMHPREIAKDIDDDLDIGRSRAETIARTEIIRAHAEGQLHAMEDLGVEEVGVMVEFRTAGDDRVCPHCQTLEGIVLRVEEAHNLIPVHPNCRCAFLPANVGENRGDQVRGKRAIDRAVEDANELGAKVSIDVSSYRPRSLVGNAFDPDQPRDDAGRWSSNGGSVITGPVFKGGKVSDDGPIFLTTDPEGAAEYGDVTEYRVSIKNPLKLKNSANSPELVKIAESAGVVFKMNEYGEMHSEELKSVSPSEQSNHLPDLLYIPKVREALREAGYDGLYFQDELYHGHIETYVALGKDQLTSNESFFAACERDERGWCMPGDVGGVLPLTAEQRTALTPDERSEFNQVMKRRVDLTKKMKDGTITEDERVDLDRVRDRHNELSRKARSLAKDAPKKDPKSEPTPPSPPAQPTPTPSPEAGGDDRSKMEAESRERIAAKHLAGLEASNLNDDQKRKYAESFRKAISRMPQKTLNILETNLKGVQWEPSFESVTDRFNETGSKSLPGTYVAGFYSYASKSACLDGGDNSDPWAIVSFKLAEGRRQVYAHELTHAIDLYGIYSNDPEWRKIWFKEIRGTNMDSKPTLSKYARSSSLEGFAEFGRLVYGTDTDHAEVARKFPKSFDYLKRNNLV